MSYLKKTPLPFFVIYVFFGLVLPLFIERNLISEESMFWRSFAVDPEQVTGVVILLLLIMLISTLFDSRKIIRGVGLLRLPSWLCLVLINSILISFLIVVALSIGDGVNFAKIRHAGSLSDGGTLGIFYAALLPCVRFILILDIISKVAGLTRPELNRKVKWLLLIAFIMSISSMRSGFDLFLIILSLSRSPLNFLRLRYLVLCSTLVITIGFVYKFGDPIKAFNYIQDSKYIEMVLSVRATSGIHSASAAISSDENNSDMLATALETSWYRISKIFGQDSERPEATINRQNFEKIALSPDLLPRAGASPGLLASLWSLGAFSGTLMLLFLLPILGILSAGNVNVVMMFLVYYGGAFVVFENPVNLFVFPSEIHLLGFISLVYANRFSKRNSVVSAR